MRIPGPRPCSVPRMALRYAILGLLSAEPMSGYDLAKWMDRGLGNIWSAHASQIYPELARMVEAGVIVEVPGDTGPRRRRVYGISDDGAADLREWLTTATLDPGGRNEALLRSVLLGQLDPRSAALAFTTEAERHRERAALHEALRDEAEAGPPSPRFGSHSTVAPGSSAPSPTGRRRPRTSTGRRRAAQPLAARLEEAVDPDPLEPAVEIDPQDVEAAEEEQQAEDDHDRAADELDRDVVIPEPPERAHRPGEDGTREHERNREPERVAREQKRALQHGVRRAREHEDRREHRADARRGADREGAAEQHPRAAAPRALHEAGTDEPLGPGQEAHEGEPEDDEDEPCHLLEQELVAEDAGPDQLGTDAERDEDGREADHERDAGENDPPRGSALAEPVGLDSGDGREIARHERQHTRGKERDEARDQRNERLRRLDRSVLVPGELLVHPALEIGVELGLP